MPGSWTPGPWRSDGVGVVAHFIARGGNWRRIMRIKGSRAYADEKLDTEDRANMQLVAAAPDMADYIERRSAEGDPFAAALWEKITSF